jgi:hypothetical protein
MAAQATRQARGRRIESQESRVHVPEQRDRSRAVEPCGQTIRLRDGSPVYFVVQCVERKGHTVKHREIVSADRPYDRCRVTTEITWSDD